MIAKEKGPNKPEFAYDFVRIHSLMICTDLIEHKVVGDTETPLLRYFLSISKLKAGVNIIAGEHMNH